MVVTQGAGQIGFFGGGREIEGGLPVGFGAGGEVGAVLGFVRRAIAEVGAEPDEQHGHVGGPTSGDDLADGFVVLGGDVLPPDLVAAVGGVTARGVEAGGDVGREGCGVSGVGGRRRSGGSVAVEPLADEAHGVERVGGALEPRPEGGARLERVVGAVLEKLVVAGGEDDEVGLVAQDLAHHRGDAIARVGDPAAVDRLPGAGGIAGGEFELEPPGKGGLAGVGVAVDGRAAETKYPETAGRFFGGKLLGGDERGAGAGGAIDRALTFEQGGVAVEAGKRIGAIGRPAEAEEAEGRLERDERQESGDDGAEGEPAPARGGRRAPRRAGGGRLGGCVSFAHRYATSRQRLHE